MTRKNALAIALAAVLAATATSAYADMYTPRDDSQAPRGPETQTLRDRDSGQEIQAPRG